MRVKEKFDWGYFFVLWIAAFAIIVGVTKIIMDLISL